MPNPFFFGFTILFAIMVAVHLLYGGYELYKALGGAVDLKEYFPGAPETAPNIFVELVTPQLRPLYMTFYAIMNIVIAMLVLPLEKAVGWKRTPITFLMVGAAVADLLLFIPIFQYNIMSFLFLVYGFVGLGMGFILNIIVNLKLFKDSTGAIRTRSLYAICAFLLMGVGLVLSLEVGWLTVFSDAITYKHEIVAGSILQIFAVVCYRLGFAKEGLSSE